MIGIEFTSEEVEALRYERFHHPHPFVQKKCETLLLKACGLSSSKIAEILAVTPNTVRNYFYEYIEGGMQSLRTMHYKGQPTELSKHRTSIEDEFRRDPPSSVAEAADRIEKLTEVSRGLTQVRAFMKRMGMGYRKTAPVPAKADPERQEEFKKNSSSQGLPKPPGAGGWCFS